MLFDMHPVCITKDNVEKTVGEKANGNSYGVSESVLKTITVITIITAKITRKHREQ